MPRSLAKRELAFFLTSNHHMSCFHLLIPCFYISYVLQNNVWKAHWVTHASSSHPRQDLREEALLFLLHQVYSNDSTVLLYRCNLNSTSNMPKSDPHIFSTFDKAFSLHALHTSSLTSRCFSHQHAVGATAFQGQRVAPRLFQVTCR